jgi:hypothetical protein
MWQEIIVFLIVAWALIYTVLAIRNLFKKSSGHLKPGCVGCTSSCHAKNLNNMGYKKLRIDARS